MNNKSPIFRFFFVREDRTKLEHQSSSLSHFEVLHCNYNGAIRPKMIFGHNFWLEGPIDLRPTRLNCILQDLFRDTPLDHILRAQICTQICIFGIFGHIWHIWVPNNAHFFLILLFSSFSYLYLFIQGCADRCAEAERQRRARALLLQLTWSFYTWKYRINVSATKCWKRHFNESLCWPIFCV